MILTYKYKLKGKRAKRVLRAMARSVNFVWNYCTSTQKETQRQFKYNKKTKWPSRFDLNKLTSGTSKELNLHGQTLQSVCKQFTDSRNLHKKCPKFRITQGSKKSLGWVPFQQQSRQITKDSVTYLGNTFKFFGAKRRPLLENAKGGCFVEDSLGSWYVCFFVEVKEDFKHGKGRIGIDLGLKTLATTSNGEKVEPLKAYQKYQKKLGVAQKANNKKQVKVINNKIKNCRKDFLHKLTHKLIKENELIVVGNVSVTNLSKRFKKNSYDASWSTLRNMLQYKASKHAANFVVVNEKYTTQTCSFCGDKTSQKRPKGIAGLGIREWECENCKKVLDRDINAARNILKLGQSALPLVEGSRGA